MRSILAKSHSLLHSGHTDRVFNQRWIQSRWKTWPQLPNAMDKPLSFVGDGFAWYSMDGSFSEFRQMAHYNKKEIVYKMDQNEKSHGYKMIRFSSDWNKKKERIPLKTYRICTDIPRPHSHGIPFLDLETWSGRFRKTLICGGLHKKQKKWI